MKNMIKFTLFLISIICFYIILSIGLELTPKFGAHNNSENINQVLLNLSYSYIAGLIFYFFISYLPYLLNKIKLKPAIDLKISDISEQVFTYIQTFEKNKIDKDISKINLILLQKLYENNLNVNGLSYYSVMMGYSISSRDFINLTKSKIINLIDSILTYKEYIDSEKILNLERIKDSKFFSLLNIDPNTNQGKLYYDNDIFKNEFIQELNKIIIELKKIQK